MSNVELKNVRETERAHTIQITDRRINMLINALSCVQDTTAEYGVWDNVSIDGDGNTLEDYSQFMKELKQLTGE